MKHRFEYYYKPPACNTSIPLPPEHRVVVETEAVTIDELLDIFQSYLNACGYSFGIEEYFMAYDPEKEGEEV